MAKLLLGTVPNYWVGLVFNCPRPSRGGEEALGQVLLRKWQNLLLGTVPIFWEGPVFNCPRPSRDGEEAQGQVFHFFKFLSSLFSIAESNKNDWKILLSILPIFWAHQFFIFCNLPVMSQEALGQVPLFSIDESTKNDWKILLRVVIFG